MNIEKICDSNMDTTTMFGSFLNIFNRVAQYKILQKYHDSILVAPGRSTVDIVFQTLLCSYC
jgi:hypothetical protein